MLVIFWGYRNSSTGRGWSKTVGGVYERNEKRLRVSYKGQDCDVIF